MIKNLTKTEYYRQKKIPVVIACRKLQPQQPVRSHLIQPLARLATQFQKIRNQNSCQNKVNLELANALKIIHELQQQLQIVTAKCYQNQEQLFSCRDLNKDLERKILKLQQRIGILQTSIQKNEFNMKVKFEQQKDQYYLIVGQYEKKIEDLNIAYTKLKNDRQQQLKSTQKFHQSSLSQANIQLRQFETEAKSDIKRYQSQLQKANQQISLMRRRITDLETCNQQHMRQLQKNNSQLTQTIVRIRTEYEHKVLTLKTDYDLTINKNKELLESIASWQRRFAKQASNWIEQKKLITQQYIENEGSWKSSYESVHQQKQKIIQELTQKGYQMNQKENEIINLRQKIRKLERQVAQLTEQNRNMASTYQRSKRQFQQNLRLDFQSKINEMVAHHQRQLTQNIYKATESQRIVIQEKSRSQLTRYIENIRILQDEKLQNSHILRNHQQQKRKLQVKIEQLQIQIQHLTKNSNDQIQSYKSQINTINTQNDQKIKYNQNIHANEMERLKSENLHMFQSIKDGYQNRIKQLNKALESREKSVYQLESKTKKLDQQYTNERMSFIGRVQAFQVTIGKIKLQKDDLTKKNRQLQLKLQQLDRERKNIQSSVQQQIQVKTRLHEQIKSEQQNNKILVEKIKKSQLSFLQNMKKMQVEVFEYKRRESINQVQIESLLKKVKDMQFKYQNLTNQLKFQQKNKIQLQRKLSQIDTGSQQKWKIIQADFNNMSKKLTEQSQRRETQLKQLIMKKQQLIVKSNKRIQELESILMRQRAQYEKSNLLVQNKCRQLEQANKKLLKSSFTVQDLQKNNSDKQIVIQNYKKQIEVLNKQTFEQAVMIKNLSMKNNQHEYNIQCYKSEIQEKEKNIKTIQNKLTSITTQFKIYKDSMSREIKVANQKQNDKVSQTRKMQDQIRSLRQKYQGQLLQISTLFSENKTTQQKCSRLMHQCSDLQKRIKQLTKQKQRILQDTEALRVKKDEDFKCFKVMITLARKQVQKKDAQIQKLKDFIKNIQIANQDLNKQIQRLTGILENHKSILQRGRGQLSKCRRQKSVFKKQFQEADDQRQKLINQKQELEKNFKKIISSNEKRLENSVKQVKQVYQKQLTLKKKEIESINNKRRIQLQEQRQQFKRREQIIIEQKKQIHKQLIEKSSLINTMKISYEQLRLAYDTTLKELQSYRKKWNKMFFQFNHTNDQLEYDKTEDKKYKKVKFEQVTEFTTEKVQRMKTQISTGKMQRGRFETQSPQVSSHYSQTSQQIINLKTEPLNYNFEFSSLSSNSVKSKQQQEQKSMLKQKQKPTIKQKQKEKEKQSDSLPSSIQLDTIRMQQKIHSKIPCKLYLDDPIPGVEVVMDWSSSDFQKKDDKWI